MFRGCGELPVVTQSYADTVAFQIKDCQIVLTHTNVSFTPTLSPAEPFPPQHSAGGRHWARRVLASRLVLRLKQPRNRILQKEDLILVTS